MNGDYPGEDAWRRLEEMEADPHHYGYIDVIRLLEAWGVTEELYSEMGTRVLIHPEARDFPFDIREREEYSPGTIQWICRSLRQLRESLI